MKRLSLVLIGLLLAATAQAGEPETPKWRFHAQEEDLVAVDADGQLYRYNRDMLNRWKFKIKSGVVVQELEGTYIRRIVRVM